MKAKKQSVAAARLKTDYKSVEGKRKILLWHRLGIGTKEVAKRLGISESYARALTKQAEQAAAAGLLRRKPPFRGLSSRACNVLVANGIKTRADVAQAFAANKLGYFRNLGEVTLKEIEAWLAQSQPAQSVPNDSSTE
jgi:transposase